MTTVYLTSTYELFLVKIELVIFFYSIKIIGLALDGFFLLFHAKYLQDAIN